MIRVQPANNQNSTVREAVLTQIKEKTHSRVKDLDVEVTDDSVTITGSTEHILVHKFHVKQLAGVGAMEVELAGRELKNEIVAAVVRDLEVTRSAPELIRIPVTAANTEPVKVPVVAINTDSVTLPVRVERPAEAPELVAPLKEPAALAASRSQRFSSVRNLRNTLVSLIAGIPELLKDILV